MTNRCDGGTYPNQAIDFRNTKAYCEGRAAAAAGDAIGTNPHAANSEANATWAAGHASWADDPANGPAEGRDCCADAYGGGYTP